MPAELGRIGVWALQPKLSTELVRALEQLGYGAVWIGNSSGDDLHIADQLLAATDRLTVATGIVNIWKDAASSIAAAQRRLAEAYPGRFVLGIGTGHPELSSDYRHPYQAVVGYLDVLDDRGVPKDDRVLAALGPRVLALARDRTRGAHPYLVTPDHTREAREILGPDVLLAPEQKVVIEPDPGRARALARPMVEPYLGLRNYLANLRRLGFTDTDFADGGSDALLSALVAHGDPTTAAKRIEEHFAAGADHVAIQLIAAPGTDPLDGYRQLAAKLT